MDLLVQELTRVETTDAEGNPEEKDFADIFHKHHDIPKNLDLVTKK
jgi:hypothetical protein